LACNKKFLFIGFDGEFHILIIEKM
jgi:hypothetical protein